MIPMDTVKTRLTTQQGAGAALRYTGIAQCFRAVVAEEGAGALYRALPPRLLSVVPMMGIQLMVYELTRAHLLARKASVHRRASAAAGPAGAAGEEASFDAAFSR